MAVWRKVVAVSSVVAPFVIARVSPQLLVGGKIWKTIPTLFLLQVFLYAVYRIVLWPNFFSPLRHLPEAPDAEPLIGSFRRIVKEPTGVPILEWMKGVPNDGLMRYKVLFNIERVLLTSPKALAEVLVMKSYEFVKPPSLREGIGRILGIGILVAEGDEHKRQRKNLSPAFAFRHVKDLYPVFWAKSLEMVKAMHSSINSLSIESEKPSSVVEVGDWASRATLDIIGLAGMGQDFNSIAAPTNDLFRVYKRIFNAGRGARLLGILNLFLPRIIIEAIPIKRNDDINEASRTIKRVAYDLIQNKKRKLANKEATGSDILSVALESGAFSDEDLVNQLMTFLAAGHETTASSMNWAIYHLSRNPQMQKRLRDELKSAGFVSPFSSESTSSPAPMELEHVAYLTAVTNEVLRINPPVTLTLREAACDATILGQRVPRGTTVIISPYAINHLPELWGPDADEFNPERWMASNAKNNGGASSNYAFMTFLHGPRSCIGLQFAKAEFMCLLAAWVAAFEFELEDPHFIAEMGPGITTKPRGGLKVKLTPLV